MSGEIVPGAQQEIAAIERTLREDSRAYWKDADLQRRYGELLAAREGVKPDAGAGEATAQEKRALERLMADRRSAYWSGPEAARNQARYREILLGVPATDASAGTPAESWRAPVETARQMLPAPVVSVLSEGAGFPANLARAQETAGAILGALGPELGHEFITSFDGLPAGAQAAVLRELAAGEPGTVRAADPAEIAGFQALDGAVAMVRAWGGEAPRRVALVLERYNRARANMTPADAAKWAHWFSAISPRERASLLWALGQGGS